MRMHELKSFVNESKRGKKKKKSVKNCYRLFMRMANRLLVTD